MRAVTADWTDTIKASHTMTTRVDVLLNGETIKENIAVTAGSITWDRTAATLARCVITAAEPTLLPDGVLSPYGYELYIRRGIIYRDGTEELAPLGVFPIQETTWADPTLLTSMTVRDRSQRVRDARLEDDYLIAAGTNYGTAIQNLINAGVPGLTYNFSTVTHTTPQIVIDVQSDRWEQAQAMATAIGHELYFDGLGRVTLRAEPNVATATPVWTVAEGADGVYLGGEATQDRGPAYNKVIATSANAANSAVYTGSALDDDPSSPTYYYGPFGRKPRFYSSPFIASNAQATSAAEGILAAGLGVAKGLSFGAVPNPAIEVGDAVLVNRSALGVANEVHLIDWVQLDLTADGSMLCRTRTRQEG